MAEEDAREMAILKEGVILRKEGAFEEALRRFDEILEINPRSAIAYRERAITLQVMGEGEEALDEYKKALAIDPSYGLREVGEVEKRKALKRVPRVRDIMTREIVSIPLGATVQDAAGVMLRRNVSSVAVREGTTVLGIVTERDFIKNYRLISGKDYAEVPVKDIMAYPLIAVSVDTTFDEAIKQMEEQGVRHLLVSADGEVVGLITLRDLSTARSELMEST